MADKFKKTKKSSPGVLSGGFISFSDMMGDTSNGSGSTSPMGETNFSVASLGIYQGSHSDLAMHCKKVTKKDLVTKMKALQEITLILKSEGSADSTLVPGFMPFFAFLFPKIALENEWMVRERFGKLLGAVVAIDRPALKPFMNEVVGPWYLLMNDPVPEVQEQFRSAFPSKKRQATISNLSGLDSYLTKFVDVDVSMLKEQCPGTPQEDIDEKRDRLVQSALSATRDALLALESESASLQCVATVLSDGAITRHAGHTQWAVRHAVLDFFTALPADLLHAHCATVVTCLTEGLTKCAETNTGTDRLLEAWGHLVPKLGESFWTHMLSAPAVLRKIFLLRGGNHDAVCDHLLPIIASLPFQLGTVNTDTNHVDASADKVFRVILSQLEDWLRAQGPESSSALGRKARGLVCILEACVYLLLRKLPNGSALSPHEERVEALLRVLLMAIDASLSIHLSTTHSARELSVSLHKVIGLVDKSVHAGVFRENLLRSVVKAVVRECPHGIYRRAELFQGFLAQEETPDHDSPSNRQEVDAEAEKEIESVITALTLLRDCLTGEGKLQAVAFLLTPYCTCTISSCYSLLGVYTSVSIAKRSMEVIGDFAASVVSGLFDHVAHWLPVLLDGLDNGNDDAGVYSQLHAAFVAAMDLLFTCGFEGREAQQAFVFELVLSQRALSCATALLHVLSRDDCVCQRTMVPLSLIGSVCMACLTGEIGAPLTHSLHFLMSAHHYANRLLSASCLDPQIPTQLLNDLYTQACRQWREEHEGRGISVWFLLSLLAYAFQHRPADVQKILKEPEVVPGVCAALPGLYLSDHHAPRRAHGQLFERIYVAVYTARTSLLPRVVVECWEDVELVVLPHMHVDVQRGLVRDLSAILNDQLVAAKWTPRHFGEQAGHFIFMQQSLSVLDAGDAGDEDTSALLITKESYWKALEDDAQSCSYALHCMDEALRQSPKVVQMMYVSKPHVLLRVWKVGLMLLAQGEIGVLAAHRHSLNIVRSLASSVQAALLHSVLALLCDPTLPQDADASMHILKLLLHEVLANNVPQRIDQPAYARLTTALPHINKMQSRNTAACYLTSALSDDAQQVHYMLKPTVIESVHIENGLYRPYYTLAMTMPVEGGDTLVVSKQTEWCRLFLNAQPQDAMTVDTCTRGADSARTTLSLPEAPAVNADGIVVLWQWLQSLTGNFLFVANALQSSSNDYVRMEVFRSVGYPQWRTRAAVLEVLVDWALNATSEDGIEAQSCIFDLRGVVLAFFTPALSRFCKEMDVHRVLRGIMRCKAAVGGGLWLVPVLTHVYSEICACEDRTGSSRVLASPEASQWCWALGAVMGGAEWNSCMDIAQRCVMPLLQTDPSIPLNAKVFLFVSYWLRRGAMTKNMSATPIGEEGDYSYIFDPFAGDQAWEAHAFTFVCDLFLAYCRGDQRIRSVVEPEERLLEIMAALHASLLRPRIQQQELVRHCDPTVMPALLELVHSDTADAWVRCAYSPHTLDAVRLAAAKLLDHLHIKAAHERVAGAHDYINANVYAQDGAGEGEGDGEAEEGKRDEDVFALVVGVQLKHRLAEYFPQTAAVSTVNDTGAEEDVDVAALTAVSMNTDQALSERRRAAQIRSYCRWWTQQQPLRAVLSWLLVLRAIDAAATTATEAAATAAGESAQTPHDNLKAFCSQFLRADGVIYRVLHCLVHVSGKLSAGPQLQQAPVPAQQTQTQQRDLSKVLQRALLVHGLPGDDRVAGLQLLAQYALYRTVCVLPSLFRAFHSDHCLHALKQTVSQFVEQRVRLFILRREVELVHIYQAHKRWDETVFEVTSSATSGEIKCNYLYDESKIELVIKLPPSYPLKNVEVLCSSRVGVSEGRYRRWVLQMIQCMSIYDQSVIDAALLWKDNVEQELKGTEPCPICYCTLHNKTMKLPSLRCPTCNNKFHPNCLFTWFKSSGKSNCVLCQQPIHH